ncbi:MAG: hypothetical protein WCC94_11835, partial [Candidatus Bathyarchaeia archaeon]
MGRLTLVLGVLLISVLGIGYGATVLGFEVPGMRYIADVIPDIPISDELQPVDGNAPWVSLGDWTDVLGNSVLGTWDSGMDVSNPKGWGDKWWVNLSPVRGSWAVGRQIGDVKIWIIRVPETARIYCQGAKSSYAGYELVPSTYPTSAQEVFIQLDDFAIPFQLSIGSSWPNPLPQVTTYRTTTSAEGSGRYTESYWAEHPDSICRSLGSAYSYYYFKAYNEIHFQAPGLAVGEYPASPVAGISRSSFWSLLVSEVNNMQASIESMYKWRAYCESIEVGGSGSWGEAPGEAAHGASKEARRLACQNRIAEEGDLLTPEAFFSVIHNQRDLLRTFYDTSVDVSDPANPQVGDTTASENHPVSIIQWEKWVGFDFTEASVRGTCGGWWFPIIAGLGCEMVEYYPDGAVILETGSSGSWADAGAYTQTTVMSTSDMYGLGAPRIYKDLVPLAYPHNTPPCNWLIQESYPVAGPYVFTFTCGGLPNTMDESGLYPRKETSAESKLHYPGQTSSFAHTYTGRISSYRYMPLAPSGGGGMAFYSSSEMKRAYAYMDTLTWPEKLQFAMFWTKMSWGHHDCGDGNCATRFESYRTTGNRYRLCNADTRAEAGSCSSIAESGSGSGIGVPSVSTGFYPDMLGQAYIDRVKANWNMDSASIGTPQSIGELRGEKVFEFTVQAANAVNDAGRSCWMECRDVDTSGKETGEIPISTAQKN